MSTTGSVYNLGRVTRLASPHQDTHTQIRHTKTLCRNCLHNLLWCTSDVPSTTDLLSLLSQDFTDFGSVSHMPPTDLFQDFPKTQPKKKFAQLCPRIHLKAAQVLPCGATWLLEGARPSSSKSASESQS
jgi:hypothetical protein